MTWHECVTRGVTCLWGDWQGGGCDACDPRVCCGAALPCRRLVFFPSSHPLLQQHAPMSRGRKSKPRPRGVKQVRGDGTRKLFHDRGLTTKEAQALRKANGLKDIREQTTSYGDGADDFDMGVYDDSAMDLDMASIPVDDGDTAWYEEYIPKQRA